MTVPLLFLRFVKFLLHRYPKRRLRYQRQQQPNLWQPVGFIFDKEISVIYISLGPTIELNNLRYKQRRIFIKASSIPSLIEFSFLLQFM